MSTKLARLLLTHTAKWSQLLWLHNSSHKSQRTASQIIYTYQDFDGTTVDIICMSTSPNQSQIRQAWTEENFDGETTHYLKTSKGKIVSSNWRNSSSNSWLNAYRTLWYQRLDAQTKPDAKEHEEIIELDRAAELAKADLGFGW